jgi:hypothetical protein
MMKRQPTMLGEQAVESAQCEAIPRIIERESSLAFFGKPGIEFDAAISEGIKIATYFIDSVLPTLDWKVLDVEAAFKFGGMEGRLDAVVESENIPFIVDHKTSAQYPSWERIQMDLQMLFYSFALHDIKRYGGVAGTIWNFISTSVPQPPRVLKDGSLSKDRSQRTTQRLYRAEIEARGLKFSDYADFIQTLDDSRYSNQFEILVTEAQIDWISHLLEASVLRMADLSLDRCRPLPGNPTNCTYCEFQRLCSDMRTRNISPQAIQIDTSFYAENPESETIREEEG